MSNYSITIYGVQGASTQVINLGSGIMTLTPDDSGDGGQYNISITSKDTPLSGFNDNGNYTSQTCGDCPGETINITNLNLFQDGIKAMQGELNTLNFQIKKFNYLTGFIIIKYNNMTYEGFIGAFNTGK